MTVGVWTCWWVPTPSPAALDLKASFAAVLCPQPLCPGDTRMGPWPRTGNQSQQTATATAEAWKQLLRGPHHSGSARQMTFRGCDL